MLNDTLIVLATGFGKGPKIAKGEGRCHFPNVFSYAPAGGGIKAGTVYGNTYPLIHSSKM